MDFNKKLEGLDLPETVTKIPKPADELKNRRKFINEVILPPLQDIQERVKDSESAFYLSLPYGNYPISLRNFPENILLVWGSFNSHDRAFWNCGVEIAMDFHRQWLIVTPGASDSISMKLPADEAFKDAYHLALLKAMTAQADRHHPIEVKPLVWQRLSGKTI